jgi:predicted small metal-binding protein
MAKVLRCNDVIPGCATEVRAESDDEVMRQVAEHAREVHGLATIDRGTAEKLKAAIRAE